MNSFKERIKAMVKLKEKSGGTNEKTYEHYDIVVVEDQISGDTYTCTKERLEPNKEYTAKVGASNIEDGTRVVEYRLNALPAGRACFGGYTDKECNIGKKIYSFADVWYKIYGEAIQTGRKFTKSELLAISPEIKEKLKDAKFVYIYAIKYKDQLPGENKFKSSKYFGACLNSDEEKETFEMLGDDSVCIQTAGNSLDGNLVIKIEDEEIDVRSFAIADRIKASNESKFEIELIKSIGSSRIYSKAKYTKEACEQIVRNYEREKEDEQFSL